MRWRRPQLLLLLASLVSALAIAQAREAAPRFTATALSGETFTNDNLKGQVALLQFWTTWCPHCRGDQSALENITRDFSGEGLVVLAVNVREPEPTVRKYLAEHPRSCHIVLTKDTNLVSEFAPRGFPLYVLIDRDGNIAGTQEGGGGELPLRNLLRRAGIGESTVDVSQTGEQRSFVPKTTSPGSAKVIEVPAGAGAPPAKPLPPALFVLKNGEKVETHKYTIIAGSVHVDAQGRQRTIPLNALDAKATIAANHERGIDLKLPTSPNEISLGF